MAMNSSSALSYLMQILREASKLTLKNKKIFLLITLSAAIILPLLSLASLISTASQTKNVTDEIMSLLGTDPRTPEYHNQLLKIKKEVIIFIVVAIIFQLFTIAISTCFTVATIYMSALSYLGKDLTLNDVYLKLRKIWLRPVITGFCIFLINGGCVLMILPLFFILILGKEIMIAFVVGVILIIVAFLISLYLSSVLVLGVVSSVLEDCCGLQALGKGQKLWESRRVVGCVLSLTMVILGSPVYLVSMVTNNQYQTTYWFFVTYVVMVYLVLVGVVNSMVYTVFYFQCKKENREEVEIREVDMREYNMVSEVPKNGSDFV